jgi:hypothetical protein
MRIHKSCLHGLPVVSGMSGIKDFWFTYSGLYFQIAVVLRGIKGFFYFINLFSVVYFVIFHGQK